MSLYRPTLLRKDSVSSRWAPHVDSVKDRRSNSVGRPRVMTLPSSPQTQSAGQAAAQLSTLKTRFPDLSSAEMTDLMNQFHVIPSSKAGWISQKSAISAVQTLHHITYDRARETMKNLHADSTDKIEMDDWIEFVVGVRSDAPSTMAPGSRSGTFQMRGADDHSSHSINEDEKIEYIDYINSKLASDPDVGGRLPIPSDTMQVFEECRDGLIICKLIEHIFPGTVHGVMSRNAGVSRKSARAYLNFPTPDRPLNKFKIAENNNVAVRAAEAIGANVVNISGQDLAEGREHLILSLLGQIIRLAASGRPRPSPRPFPTFPSPKMVQRVNRVPSPISSEKSIPPLSLDDDEPTRVPNTPTSFVMRRDTTPTRDRGRDYSVDYSRDHDRDHDRDQIAELGLRSKLLKRGTFNLFEDVKGGIIILQTLEKVSPPRERKAWIPSQYTGRANSQRDVSPTPSGRHTVRPISPTLSIRHSVRPTSPTGSMRHGMRARSPTPTMKFSPKVQPIRTTQSKPTHGYQSPLLKARQSSSPAVMTTTQEKESGPPPTHGIDVGILAQRRAMLTSITNRG